MDLEKRWKRFCSWWGR